MKETNLPQPQFPVIWESGPLRCKLQINGVPRLQGVFTMYDQQGFPIDMSYEIARERGWDVDWVEALADAARQCVLKYDALVKEIGMLEPDKMGFVVQLFAMGLVASAGETFQKKADSLYQQMRTPHDADEQLTEEWKLEVARLQGQDILTSNKQNI